METGISIIQIVNWIGYFFPSLSTYLIVVCPVLISIIGALSIFSNILPGPGYEYPVPEKEDLEVEFGDTAKIIMILAKLSRLLTIYINKLFNTSFYKWFYIAVRHGSALTGYLKLAKTVRTIQLISPPDPFIPKSHHDNDNHPPDHPNK